MPDLPHLDESGRATMVDVSSKPVTRRAAVAAGRISLTPTHLNAMEAHPKGDPLAVAQVAAIQAVKKTSELVPLCHPIPLEKVSVSLAVSEGGVDIRCECVAEARTGVEMEAIVGVSVAAITIYDMLKSEGHGMEIGPIKLLSKTGGKSDWNG